MFGSIIIFIFLFIFLFRKNEKGLLVIIVISLLNDLFELSIISKIKIYHLVGLLYSVKVIVYWIKNSGKIKEILKPLIIEYYYLIVLGVIFGFLLPWEGNYDHLRTWSQQAQGRTIVQLIRLFSEFCLLFLIFYWIDSKKITINYISNIISIVIILSVSIAIIDSLLDYKIRSSLFGDARIIHERFIGLCGEPRYFGRICSFCLLYLIIVKHISISKYVNWGILFSSIGIILSLSASTYVFTIIWMLIFCYYKTLKFNPLYFVVLLIVLFFLKNSFNEQLSSTGKKMNIVLNVNDGNKEDKIDNYEPDIFGRFEVFDRAALNFLYRNPEYIIIGVGPNLISIPSSPYKTRSIYEIYGENLDSVPHSFIINLLARSGLIGIYLWILFFFKVIFKLKNKSRLKTSFFISIYVSNMIVNVSIFYFFLGIIMFLLNDKKQINNA